MACSRLLRLAVVVLISAFFASCSHSSKVEGTIVSQTLSPNGQVVALITRYSGNATVSFVDRIYLKSTGEDQSQLILKADKSDKVSVKWIDDRHLQISLPCAQIFSYTNFFYLMKDGKLVRPISIELMNAGLCGQT
jgi:hypothetical protein